MLTVSSVIGVCGIMVTHLPPSKGTCSYNCPGKNHHWLTLLTEQGDGSSAVPFARTSYVRMISLSTRRAAKSFRQKHSNVSESPVINSVIQSWKFSVPLSDRAWFTLGVSCNRLGQHSCLRCKVRGKPTVQRKEGIYMLVIWSAPIELRLCSSLHSLDPVYFWWHSSNAN